MSPQQVVGDIINVLAQLGLLSVIQAMAVVLAAAAIINYFLGRRG